ncbi:MAG: hypothetical protein WA790_02695 [Sulfitobacter sp.]
MRPDPRLFFEDHSRRFPAQTFAGCCVKTALIIGMAEDATLAFGAAIIASGRVPEVAATGKR